jgi:HlyD family secretion protein
MSLLSFKSSIAVVGALAVGAVAGYLVRPRVEGAFRSTPGSTTENRAEPSRPVSALARLQPKDGVIPVYGPPGDRIVELSVRDVGKRLHRGDAIATLLSHEVRQTEVAVAELQLGEARETLAKLTAAGKAKIAAARLEAEQATADEEKDKEALNLQIAVLGEQYEFATSQFTALKQIAAKGGTVSDEEMRRVRLAVSKAKSEADGTKIKLDKIVAGYARARVLANAKVAAAEAEVAELTARVPLTSATKKVELAKQVRDLAVVTSPVDGTVVRINSHAGDPTGAQQPLLHLADTSKMVAVAEVYEADAPRLWDGLTRGRTFVAKLSSPALPGGIPLTGTVRSADQVNRMISRNAIFALGPREDTDRRVIDVTIDLDPAAAEVAGNYIGLQVNIELAPAAEK